MEILAKKIIEDKNNPTKFYIWKCRQSNTIIPSNLSFGKVIKPNDIHISCFSFHIMKTDLVKFASKRGEEYEIVKGLSEQLHVSGLMRF